MVLQDKEGDEIIIIIIIIMTLLLKTAVFLQVGRCAVVKCMRVSYAL